VLKAQLRDSVFRQEDIENEAIRVRSSLGKKKMENQKLNHRANQLEEELYKKHEPPPPPPPPPKSLFSNLKNPFLKKSKQFCSVPENIHTSHARQGKRYKVQIA
jgi:hypothetical protein